MKLTFKLPVVAVSLRTVSIKVPTPKLPSFPYRIAIEKKERKMIE